MKEIIDFVAILLVSLFTTSDIIILLVGIITGFFYFLTKQRTRNIDKILVNKHRRASKVKEKSNETSLAELEDLLQPKIMLLNKFYTILMNLISIFPLLGMLGTVKSLIGLASGLSDTSASLEISLFFSALTSTAWGIIFAMFFKIITSGIAVKVENCNKEYEIIAARVTESHGEQYEVQRSAT